MSILTFYDRGRIEYYLNFKKLSLRKIAQLIGRNHTVVVREVSRNKGQCFPYNAELAQRIAQRRAKKTNKRKLDKDQFLHDYVLARLKDGWSPQQIAGRLKKHPPPEVKGNSISHEHIYQYLYQDAKDEYGERWCKYLRRRQTHRQPQYSRQHRRITIPHRLSIHLRPDEVSSKNSYGHWESDTVICKYRRPISVQYERKSMLVRINKLANFKPESTNQAIIKTLDSLPLYLVKSLTFDNGLENSQHHQLKESFDLQTYFCDPYKSWQKGGVENINGLIREYLPRKTNLHNITDQNIQQIQEKLNNRPRKSLNYLTPNEIIDMQIGRSGALNS